MRRSRFARVFRVLAIVGIVPVIPNFVLSFMEPVDMVGYGIDWLFWMTADIFACTALGLSLLVMAVAGYRKGVVLYPFRLRKPVEELTPAERLEYHCGTMGFAVLPLLTGVFLCPVVRIAIRSSLGSLLSPVVWLLIACEVICLALISTAVITGIVLARRAKRLRRKEAASSGTTGDEIAPARHTTRNRGINGTGNN